LAGRVRCDYDGDPAYSTAHMQLTFWLMSGTVSLSGNNLGQAGGWLCPPCPAVVGYPNKANTQSYHDPTSITLST
jgi:hypothetical protein